MYVTWYFATIDLRQRIAQAAVKARKSVDDVTTKFEAIAKSVCIYNIQK